MNPMSDITMNKQLVIQDAPVSPSRDLDATAAQAAALAGNARAAATRRAYASDWTHFETWCSTHRLVSLPAAPVTIGLYLAHHHHTLSMATLERRVSSIAVAHRLAGYPCDIRHPAIRDVLVGLRRAMGTRQRQVAPLTIPLVKQALAGCGERLLDIRDRALVLVALAGALRRSEVVGLDVTDISHVAGGLRVVIRRSKGDQDGAGEVIQIGATASETCPVAAYDRWIARAGISEGPAFRSVTRHGRLGAKLTDQHVSLIVKKRVAEAGLDPSMYSGHSCRAGFATAAALAGLEERVIARQTRHRSMTVLRRYIRDGELFRVNLAGQIGL